MSSIYQDFYQLQRIQGSNEPTVAELSDPSKRSLKFLHTARFFLTNAKVACTEFLKGRLSNLDPIVGENSCQIRALGVLMSYEDLELMQEAEKSLEKTQGLLKHVLTLQNKPPLCKPDTPIEEFIEKTGLSFSVSERMLFIFRSNLLTVGKVFHFDPNGREVSRIDYSVLAQRLCKSVSTDVVRGIALIAREQIAMQSIHLIQKEAGKLKEVPGQHPSQSLQDTCIRDIRAQELLFKSSCAFYNFKVILHRICDERIPILLKGYFTKEKHYYLLQEGKLSLVSAEFSPKQKMFVVECMAAKGKTLDDLIPIINEKGLLEVLLANVAVLPQHSENDDMSLLDEQAREEIIKYREMGKELRCNSSDPEIFSVLHTHAATVQEEK